MLKRHWFLLLALLLAIAAGLSAAAGWSKGRLLGSTGLVETFYQGTDFSGPPVLQRTTSGVDLSILDDHPSLPRRLFSLRFTGTWVVPVSGPAEIYAGGDDSVRVFIDNDLIIERNQELGFSTTAAGTTLRAGPHEILIEYVQRGGGASLNVLWAPAGKARRPLSPESLFVGPPNAGLIARARLAARLAALARMAWMAFGIVPLAGLLVLAGRRLRRWMASGVLRDVTQQTLAAVARWQARHGREAFWVASGVAAVWIAGTRLAALNPQTLWSDDVAVACLTKLDSLWAAMTVPAPLAPGFVALLWIARRTMADPEVSLQLLPLVFGLAGPVLTGVVVSRLTSSYLLGVLAVVLGLGCPNLAQYSVFVKPYSLDYALTALFLLLAVRLLVDRREVQIAVAAVGLASVLFSMPSVFLSLPLVHVAALLPQPNPGDAPSKWRRWGTVAAFDLLLVVIYFVALRSRSNPALRVWWSDSFAPATSLAAFAGFLRTTGWTAIREALPAPLAVLAPLAAAGLAALVISPKTRWFGSFVALVYAGAVAASLLQLYPIGVGLRARVSIYTYAMTTALVVVGFDVLTRWLPVRTLVRAAAAVAVVWYVAQLTPPAYPQLDQIQLVRALESGAAADDAIVLNTPGANLAGYYASWPLSTYPDESSYGFAVRIERPRTLTLPRSSEEDGSGLNVLDGFLEREHPATMFLFSTRRDTRAAEHAIRARGFEEAGRKTGNVSAQLIEYRRVGAR